MLREGSRTRLIRIGFSAPSDAIERIERLAELLRLDADDIAALVEPFDADPDGALSALLRLLDRHPDLAERWRDDAPLLRSAVTLFGASPALAEFFRRHPHELVGVHEGAAALPHREEITAAMLASVKGRDVDAATASLRVAYRAMLARIALYDLRLADPEVSLHRVAGVLADLAGGTIEAALRVARESVSAPPAGFGRFPRDEVEQVRLAVIGMGKCGAEELNYISDVDVLFVAAPVDEAGISGPRAIEIGARIASAAMRIVHEPGVEPGLFEVDPNLRPEGKHGALVRSLDSYFAYYDRWAQNWEFQALLKARAIAGDPELGEEFVAGVQPRVWGAAGRDDFVLQVQAMRERVIAHIPADEVDRELKLGPGGLRDVEFTVQLLQLVHGQVDESLRVRGTLDALTALVGDGFIGRDDGAAFTNDYRFLRLLEHRVQLRHLRRTHLLPADEAELRILARAARCESTAELLERLAEVRRRVRGLHQAVFYRPLLSAVAQLPTDRFQLTSEQAAARLRAIGFRDPRGALGHIEALIKGVSRRATMQRNLLPVLLDWLGRGAFPDRGLLAFRKLSEQNGEASWYLRLLRDSNLAARRLCALLSSSQFCAAFFELFPEAVQWLDGDDRLRPVGRAALDTELAGALRRHDDERELARVLRNVRRRETLRLAIGFVLGVADIDEIAAGLSDLASAVVGAAVDLALAEAAAGDGPAPAYALIAMGRYGGAELGFGSDLDVLHVVDPGELAADVAATAARRYVTRIDELLADPRLPIELDADLRPEGRSGPLVRSLAAYAAYYERWSLGWEAQALLRARPVAGDERVGAEFVAIADRTRYRAGGLAPGELIEIRRIKARVESERLPRGADPKRHLKLGRGSLSDVEWLVQTWQLEHAHEVPALRTASTLDALGVAREQGWATAREARVLREAWLLASRIRSAVYLALNAQTDVLPTSPVELDAVARLLGYEPGHGVDLENDYLATTRQARAVFERLFYGD
ncbi:MAG: bifunctional [glutamine synthetase] adenylyltransferase/[glutamine synthetase]-adenylyl-L-tyrosine phosphorylase [Microbacteriaceae bacterium]|nr:bifunctional [glutamine synthetase] adenylyltransferase/[glutamine synthetase]-adenylyl-L-tyrosine phosphorylase [Microbacteriaceae bacterium]